MDDLLPTVFVKRLTAYCSSLDVAPTALQPFMNYVVSSLKINDGEKLVEKQDSVPLKGLSSDDSRHFFNALATLFITAAQHNYAVEKMKEFFQNIGAKQQVADVITRSYQVNRGDIRSMLANIGSSSIRLCDVTWRLDFINKDSEMDETKEFSYTVTFLLQHSNQPNEKAHELSFFCSMQQLQEIIAKLKFAMSAVERLASSGCVATRPGGEVVSN